LINHPQIKITKEPSRNENLTLVSGYQSMTCEQAKNKGLAPFGFAVS
jgi:hypothetical protein